MSSTETKRKKAYFPTRDNLLQNFFFNHGWDVSTNPNDKDIDAVVFSGGEDVTPFLYGETPHKETRWNATRDMHEIRIFNMFRDPKIMKIGVCRGGQFLNVMNGGSLFQDVDNHAGGHDATCFLTGTVIKVSSTHHQMMIPGYGAEIVLTASCSSKRESMKRDSVLFVEYKKENNNLDLEACFYSNTNSLCFQPHPEYPGYPDLVKYFMLCINEYSKRTVEDLKREKKN